MGKLLSCLSALVVFAGVGSAQAATYEFSYDIASTGQVLAGNFEADVYALDADLLAITSVSNVTLDGTSVGPMNYVNSVTGYLAATAGPALVAFDLSYMDVLVCFTSDCLDGFLFTENTSYGDSVFGSGLSFGGAYDAPLNTGGFELVSEVPLPAAGWMLLAGIGGLGLMRRKNA